MTDSQGTPVPASTRANEVLNQVLAEHDLSQAWLCDETGFESSYVSRILSNQYAVPTEMVRAVWRKTGDHRVAALVLGEFSLIAVPLPDAPPSVADATSTAMSAMGNAIVRLAEVEERESTITRHAADRAINEAIRALSVARRSIFPSDAALARPAPRQARPLTPPTPARSLNTVG